MPKRIRGRLLYEGCYTHVFSRALDKRFIFKDEEDFELFKSLLLKTKTEQSYCIHHYCLMNTHFHLIASISNVERFSMALKELKQTYARWFQFKYERKGPIWWGRFGSQVIESERYMYACGLYVEMNPVKAKMARAAEDWPHSSSRHYFLGQKDVLVDEYEKPHYDVAMQLTEGLNICRGSYIGTPLFVLRKLDG